MSQHLKCVLAWQASTCGMSSPDRPVHVVCPHLTAMEHLKCVLAWQASTCSVSAPYEPAPAELSPAELSPAVRSHLTKEHLQCLHLDSLFLLRIITWIVCSFCVAGLERYPFCPSVCPWVRARCANERCGDGCCSAPRCSGSSKIAQPTGPMRGKTTHSYRPWN